jgi:hypothetical protein
VGSKKTNSYSTLLRKVLSATLELLDSLLKLTVDYFLKIRITFRNNIEKFGESLVESNCVIRITNFVYFVPRRCWIGVHKSNIKALILLGPPGRVITIREHFEPPVSICECRFAPLSLIFGCSPVKKEETREHCIGKSAMQCSRLKQHVAAAICKVLLIVSGLLIYEVDRLHRNGQQKVTDSNCRARYCIAGLA